MTAAALADLLAAPSAPRSLRPGARPRSIGMAKLTPEEREELWRDLAELRRRGVYQRRPRTWGDCARTAGPCPWVSCRHHLYLEVDSVTGRIKLNFPDRQPWELAETCALRAAAKRGALSLEEVGKLLNLSQERTSQIEESGLVRIRRRLKGPPGPASRKSTSTGPLEVGGLTENRKS